MIITAGSTRWQGYLNSIATSLQAYEGCWGSRCDCHGEVINSDLRVWRERGGIEWAEFETAKKVGGVHYQIIDHKLYREEKCMFNAR